MTIKLFNNIILILTIKYKTIIISEIKKNIISNNFFNNRSNNNGPNNNGSNNNKPKILLIGLIIIVMNHNYKYN